jgi:zinc protease
MMSGANTQSAQQLAARLDAVGARYGADSLRDMAWLSLRSLTMPELLDEAVTVMADVFGKPDFPEDELELVRTQMLAVLKNQAQEPVAIAQKAFYKALYGKHPYGQAAEAKDINALTRADIRAFYEQFYVAENATLSIVGKLERGAAELLAQQLVKFLPSGEKARALPVVEPLQKAKTIRISFPSKQSHILIGQPSIARGEADYFALSIANHVLGGGGFASILMEQVREKRGLAYNVYSYLSAMQARGPFMIGLQTKNDQVEEVIELVQRTLDDFLEQGPSKDAFAASVSNITGASPLNTDTNAKLVRYASLIAFYGLPLDYLAVYNDKILAETRHSVHQAFSDRIQSDKLITVIVGGEN